MNGKRGLLAVSYKFMAKIRKRSLDVLSSSCIICSGLLVFATSFSRFPFFVFFGFLNPDAPITCFVVGSLASLGFRRLSSLLVPLTSLAPLIHFDLLTFVASLSVLLSSLGSLRPLTNFARLLM